MSRRYLIALINAEVGRESDYEAWYARGILPGMIADPGFPAGALFRCTGGMNRWSHLAIFPTEGVSDPALTDRLARAIGEHEPGVDLSAQASTAMLIGETRGDEGLPLQDMDLILAAFCDPVPESVPAFHDWMDRQHAPDMLRVPGVKSATRLSLASAGAGGKSPYQFTTFYELLPMVGGVAVLVEVGRRVRTPAMPVSDAAVLKEATVSVFARVARVAR